MGTLKTAWRWLRDRLPFSAGSLTLLDVMRLAENEGCDAQAFISKVYEWEHARQVEVGKWLLALSAAMIVAVMTLVSKEPASNLPPYLVLVAGTGAGIAGISGFLTIWSARSIATRLARTAALTAQLVAIRTFLTRVRKEEGL